MQRDGAMDESKSKSPTLYRRASLCFSFLEPLWYLPRRGRRRSTGTAFSQAKKCPPIHSRMDTNC
jgi:hypothetical protein